MNRREALQLIMATASTSALAQTADNEIDPGVIQQHDARLKETLAKQVTDPNHRGFGAYPDQWQLYHCYAAASLLENAVAAYLHPRSAYYHDQPLLQRISWAVDFLNRNQSPEGNIDLLTTNFASPPDTGFVVHHVATAAKLAALHQADTIAAQIKPFLLKAGEAMSEGGVHTPNHRWVVCAALAQIHHLYPNQKYLDRINAWLAEGIDIDEEGQFHERSTTIYNAVCDNALVTLAHKLDRNDLLEPVRKNLDSMLYLLHPNYEVVTEISKRQDINTNGTMNRYWFALRFMAVYDDNGQYASIVNSMEPERISLPLLMEYPLLRKPLPKLVSPPQQYNKVFPLSEISHIRRGKLSATIMHRQNSRWFALRNGNAVINAVRFASAFYGKGQFNPERFHQDGDAYIFTQEMKAPYYQPITDPSLKPITSENLGRAKQHREQTNVSVMQYETKIVDKGAVFELHISAAGTDNVPIAIEINLRAGGTIEGVIPAPNVAEAFLLDGGYATYTLGRDVIRFGPGRTDHTYTQIRGALTKLPGPSVYITGYAPFQHVIHFEAV